MMRAFTGDFARSRVGLRAAEPIQRVRPDPCRLRSGLDGAVCEPLDLQYSRIPSIRGRSVRRSLLPSMPITSAPDTLPFLRCGEPLCVNRRLPHYSAVSDAGECPSRIIRPAGEVAFTFQGQPVCRSAAWVASPGQGTWKMPCWSRGSFGQEHAASPHSIGPGPNSLARVRGLPCAGSPLSLPFLRLHFSLPPHDADHPREELRLAHPAAVLHPAPRVPGHGVVSLHIRLVQYSVQGSEVGSPGLRRRVQRVSRADPVGPLAPGDVDVALGIQVQDEVVPVGEGKAR